MKRKFVPDPFDIAPQAQRHTRASWAVLVAGVLFAGACAWPLVLSVQAVRQIETARSVVIAALRAQAEGQRVDQLRQKDPAALERTKAQQQLQYLLRMSWTGLFEALETAAQKVHGGVSILALVPSKTQTDAALVGITALAANPAVMLKYIETLQNDLRVRQVEITMQQPDDKVGPEVVRFQLSVLWDPSATVSSSDTGGSANLVRAAKTSP